MLIVESKPTLYTVLSPRLLDLYDLSSSIVVIIDVFRATSTIATALYNGATKVIPVATVEECKEIGSSIPESVTAGERDGKVIPGLQHGNSPAEYTREFIADKTLVLTTTNGTRLLHMARQNGAAEIITGSFPNLSAVSDYLLSRKKNVILGCSAWKDRINIEDTLFAGAVASRLQNDFSIHCDSSRIAMNMYENNKNDLVAYAKTATHWHRLSNFGLAYDLNYCVTPDGANTLVLYKNGELVRG